MSTSATQGRFVIPEVVVTHFHLRKGEVVADFGAGTGFFLPSLSRLVGTDGKVYACEIQRTLTESIGQLLRSKNIGNVQVLWCDIEAPAGTKLRDGALDAGVVVNSLFQMEQKDAAFVEMVRTLRRGGKLFVIDWSESFGGLGPHPEQVITADAVKSLAESHGLLFERSFDAGDHHYGLAFRKP
ncbi:MAG: methyltransferase domain-containing protein [Candidatus Paceibacterota bacterium]